MIDFYVVIFLVVFGVAFFLLALTKPFQAFLITLPFVVVTRSLELPIVGERIILFDILIIVLLLSLTIRQRNHTAKKKWPQSFFFLFISLYALIIAMLMSLIDVVSLTDGLLSILVYVFSVCIAFVTFQVSEESIKHVERIARQFLWILPVVVLIALYEALFIPRGFPEILPGRSLYRVTSTFRNPNQLATFINLILPFLLSYLFFARVHKRYILPGSLAVIITLFVVLLTGSRTGVVVSIVQIIMLLLFLLARWKHNNRYVLISAVGLFLIIFFAGNRLISIAPQQYLEFSLNRVTPTLVSFSANMFTDPMIALEGGETANEFSRNNWRLPITAFGEHPIKGIGLGNFGYSYQLVTGVTGTEVHGQYLSFLAETGILGTMFLFIFLVMIIYHAHIVFKASDDVTSAQYRWLFIGLYLAILTGMLTGVYVHFLRRREFWILLGLVMASYAHVVRMTPITTAREVIDNHRVLHPVIPKQNR
jgi:O-antigen ligase